MVTTATAPRAQTHQSHQQARPSSAIASNTQSQTMPANGVNVGDVERAISAAVGGMLTICGLRHGSISGLLVATFGGALLYRGASGHCHLYSALGMSTASDKRASQASVEAEHGVKIEKSIAINRPASELYQFWSEVENLPQVMSHLVSVEKRDGKRSHWKAKGPAGFTVEWDAETINEKPYGLIAWRSLPGSDIDTAGSVHFKQEGSSTHVTVTLKYDPPAGKVGAAIARLFGQAPEQQIEADLQRFKQKMESGDMSKAAGQTAGRK